jgi:hypothetical protein
VSSGEHTPTTAPELSLAEACGGCEAGRHAAHAHVAAVRCCPAAARAAGSAGAGFDGYSFTIAFKGVLLEGLEVAFIVLTFGANQHNVGLAARWKALACSGLGRANNDGVNWPAGNGSPAHDCFAGYTGFVGFSFVLGARRSRQYFSTSIAKVKWPLSAN